MKKAKRKSVKKQPRTTLSLLLPHDVIAFYRQVADVSGVSMNDVVNVVLAIRAIGAVNDYERT